MSLRGLPQYSKGQLSQRHPLGHPDALGLLFPQSFLDDQEGVLGEEDGLPRFNQAVLSLHAIGIVAETIHVLIIKGHRTSPNRPITSEAVDGRQCLVAE
jgi:hypothetical protein